MSEPFTKREETMMEIVNSMDAQVAKMQLRYTEMRKHYWLAMLAAFQGGMIFGICITRWWWGLLS